MKDVYPRESIGYGRTFVVNREMKDATIPRGYTDGFWRELSINGKVEVSGRVAAIIGRVLELKCSDEVTLISEHYTADGMAKNNGTIGEIVCVM